MGMKINKCSACGSKDVGLANPVADCFKDNFVRFGCHKCKNNYMADKRVQYIELVEIWNDQNPEKETLTDDVNHPSHYQSENGIECIDAIVAALGINGAIAYCRGNVIKYSWRTDKKNGAQDLRKAEWYSRKAAELMGEKE